MQRTLNSFLVIVTTISGLAACGGEASEQSRRGVPTRSSQNDSDDSTAPTATPTDAKTDEAKPVVVADDSAEPNADAAPQTEDSVDEPAPTADVQEATPENTANEEPVDAAAPTAASQEAASENTTNEQPADAPEATPVAVIEKNVIINGSKLAASTLQQIEADYRIVIEDGSYWYDSRSGLWGVAGQAPAGVGLAGLQLGGALHADASKGDAGVFINGRQLTQAEVALLDQAFNGAVTLNAFFGVTRYWLNGDGSYGVEGSEAALGNLYQAAKSASGGGDNYHANGYTNSYSNSQGGCSYVMTDSGTATSGCG